MKTIEEYQIGQKFGTKSDWGTLIFDGLTGNGKGVWITHKQLNVKFSDTVENINEKILSGELKPID